MTMEIAIHPHARERVLERGTSHDEVIATVMHGERIPAKYGRVAFRRNFPFGGCWRDRAYETKQVEVVVVEEEDRILVITVIVRFF